MSKQQQVEISVELRETGKHLARTLRSGKRIPAVVYGPKVKNVTFSLAENDAVRFSQHQFENTIFVLKSPSNDLNNLKVLKKNVTWHPVSRRPVHMDFYALDMTQKVRISVEIRFTGRAEGQKEGGVLNVIRRDVEVECLPLEIPEAFEVDISNMQVNDVLHVRDVKVPESIRIITGLEETICTVAVPKEEEAAPVAAATDAAAAAATPAAGSAAGAAAGDAKAAAKPEGKG